MNLFENEVLTVSEITRDIKFSLEEEFSAISVVGEISNFKAHASGHWYFCLKDDKAVINCTMWKGFNNYVFFTPQNGIKAVVNGKITVYPPRGTYQVDVRSMKPAGEGELQAAFERLKKKLSDEGLFDEEFKKSIPQFPEKIGVITAIDGAAFKDMISVLERRYPLAEILIAPVRVQGSGSSQQVVDAIKKLNESKIPDVIIIGRGGGSIEDLWAFNEEIVARAIFNSKIPIVTGIGHEIDFTIADFVADLRAPTPSVAMEMVTPDKNEIFAFIGDFLYNSTQNIKELLADHRLQINNIVASRGFKFPIDLIRNYTQRLDNNIYKISKGVERKLMISDNRLALASKSIEGHDIQRTLKKGFTLIKQDGNLVKRKTQFKNKQDTTVQFYDGELAIKKPGKNG